MMQQPSLLGSESDENFAPRFVSNLKILSNQLNPLR